MSKTC